MIASSSQTRKRKREPRTGTGSESNSFIDCGEAEQSFGSGGLSDDNNKNSSGETSNDGLTPNEENQVGKNGQVRIKFISF